VRTPALGAACCNLRRCRGDGGQALNMLDVAAFLSGVVIADNRRVQSELERMGIRVFFLVGRAFR